MIRRKLMTVTLSAMMVLSVATPSSALEKWDRIKGKNNYETAAKIADKRSYSSIVLVNMDKTVADGLSSAALAGCKNGVILFTSKNSIPAETREKLNYVNDVYIIGQDDVISKSVEEDLVNMGKNVTRLGGNDRYDTSRVVAEEVLATEKNLKGVFVVNGVKGEADVVSASPVAYREKMPILLTNGKTLKHDLEKIADNAAKRYIVGGTDVVKDSVKNSIKTSERISGKNRFATNEKIVKKFYSNPKEFNVVGANDYAIATVASSISTEKPIALADENHDPYILKNAEDIIAIGNINDTALSKAIGYSGGLNKFKYDWTNNRYIAHALGGVGGKTYTNSPQALEHNYNKGFKVFEVDLDLSSDGELIAWHSFGRDSLIEMGVPEKYASKKPTVEEFKQIKSYGKYDTMTFRDIVDYMEQHPDVYMVIDLKQAEYDKVTRVYQKIVEEAGSDVLERIIPQAYREESYNAIMDVYRFKSMILTCYNMAKLNEDEVTNFCAKKGIKVLTIDYRFFTNSLVQKCNAKGIKIYMNTYNDINSVNNYRKKGVQGFYTDFLTP